MPSISLTEVAFDEDEAATHLIDQARPVYPTIAKAAHIEGDVRVIITIGTDGNVSNVSLMSGSVFLMQAARDAVRQWKYRPFMQDGSPVAAITTSTITFSLDSQIEIPITRVFPKVQNLDSLIITMKRPGYSLKILGTGEVQYLGETYVCVEGKHIGHISSEDVQHLVNVFRDSNYFSFGDEYDAAVTDIGETDTSISLGDIKKSIRNRWGAPPALKEIEKQIDVLSHSAKWVVGNSETVPALQAEKYDINHREANGWTTLFGATLYADAEVVQDLLRAGATPRIRDTLGQTPLGIAARRGLADMVMELIAVGADVHATTNDGVSVLMYAASSGNQEVVRQVLTKRPNVNQRDKNGETVLMFGAASDVPGVVKLLLDSGARANDRSMFGLTALIAASHANYLTQDIDYTFYGISREINEQWIDSGEVIRLLVAAGAKVNEVDDEGQTALFSLDGDAVRELIRTKINLNIRDQYGMTALSGSVAGNIVELLAGAGADMNILDSDGRTALMRAAENNVVDILEALTKAGAKLNLQDKEGWTAAMFAAHEDLPKALRVLVDAHADINIKNSKGETALRLAHLSAMRPQYGYYPETIAILGSAGAVE